MSLVDERNFDEEYQQYNECSRAEATVKQRMHSEMTRLRASLQDALSRDSRNALLQPRRSHLKNDLALEDVATLGISGKLQLALSSLNHLVDVKLNENEKLAREAAEVKEDVLSLERSTEVKRVEVHDLGRSAKDEAVSVESVVADLSAVFNKFSELSDEGNDVDEMIDDSDSAVRGLRTVIVNDFRSSMHLQRSIEVNARTQRILSQKLLAVEKLVELNYRLSSSSCAPSDDGAASEMPHDADIELMSEFRLLYDKWVSTRLLTSLVEACQRIECMCGTPNASLSTLLRNFSRIYMKVLECARAEYLLPGQRIPHFSPAIQPPWTSRMGSLNAVVATSNDAYLDPLYDKSVDNESRSRTKGLMVVAVGTRRGVGSSVSDVPCGFLSAGNKLSVESSRFRDQDVFAGSVLAAMSCRCLNGNVREKLHAQVMRSLDALSGVFASVYSWDGNRRDAMNVVEDRFRFILKASKVSITLVYKDFLSRVWVDHGAEDGESTIGQRDVPLHQGLVGQAVDSKCLIVCRYPHASPVYDPTTADLEVSRHLPSTGCTTSIQESYQITPTCAVTLRPRHRVSMAPSLQGQEQSRMSMNERKSLSSDAVSTASYSSMLRTGPPADPSICILSLPILSADFPDETSMVIQWSVNSSDCMFDEIPDASLRAQMQETYLRHADMLGRSLSLLLESYWAYKYRRAWTNLKRILLKVRGLVAISQGPAVAARRIQKLWRRRKTNAAADVDGALARIAAKQKSESSRKSSPGPSPTATAAPVQIQEVPSQGAGLGGSKANPSQGSLASDPASVADRASVTSDPTSVSSAPISVSSAAISDPTGPGAESGTNLGGGGSRSFATRSGVFNFAKLPKSTEAFLATMASEKCMPRTIFNRTAGTSWTSTESLGVLKHYKPSEGRRGIAGLPALSLVDHQRSKMAVTLDSRTLSQANDDKRFSFSDQTFQKKDTESILKTIRKSKSIAFQGLDASDHQSTEKAQPGDKSPSEKPKTDKSA